MNVCYSRQVATAKYGAFFKLLFRWQGSVFKQILPDLLIFCFAYASLSIVYRLTPSGPFWNALRTAANNLSYFSSGLATAIPMGFILGFYVTLSVGRWWERFQSLPTSDSIAFLLCTYVKRPVRRLPMKAAHSDPKHPLVIRKRVIRYCEVSAILCFRSISSAVLRKYPDYQSLISSGLLSERELKCLSGVVVNQNPYFIPLVWSANILVESYKEGFIEEEVYLTELIAELNKFREALLVLQNYDWVNIPLVYSQVVAIIVYMYFIICIVSRQFTVQSHVSDQEVSDLTTTNEMFKRSVDFLSSRPNRSSTSWTHQIQDPSIDLYLPIFTLLELVFYDGWLKIAQALVNPFGTEDSDFDLVALSERNYLIGLWFTSLTNSRYLEPAVIEHQCFGWTGLKRPSFSRQTTTSSMSRFDKSNKSDVVLDSGHVDVETDGIKQESQTEDDQSDFTYISKEPDEIYQLPASLSSLRRSESKYFLAGSIARLTKEAESRQHQSRAELGHGAIN